MELDINDDEEQRQDDENEDAEENQFSELTLEDMCMATSPTRTKIQQRWKKMVSIQKSFKSIGHTKPFH